MCEVEDPRDGEGAEDGSELVKGLVDRESATSPDGRRCVGEDDVLRRPAHRLARALNEDEGGDDPHDGRDAEEGDGDDRHRVADDEQWPVCARLVGERTGAESPGEADRLPHSRDRADRDRGHPE